MWRSAAVQPLMASSGSISILRVHTSDAIPTLVPSRVRLQVSDCCCRSGQVSSSNCSAIAKLNPTLTKVAVAPPDCFHREHTLSMPLATCRLQVYQFQHPPLPPESKSTGGGIELVALYKRFVGLDIHQAHTACAFDRGSGWQFAHRATTVRRLQVEPPGTGRPAGLVASRRSLAGKQRYLTERHVFGINDYYLCDI